MAFCGFQGNEVITLKEQHLLSKFSTNALCFQWRIFSVHENDAYVYNEKEYEKKSVKMIDSSAMPFQGP